MADATSSAPGPRPGVHTDPGSGGRPVKKRSRAVLWLWLTSSLLAIFCFLLTHMLVMDSPLAIVVMWVPFLIGIGLLLLGGLFALVAAVSFLRHRSLKSPILSLVCVAAGAGSVWGLVKAAGAMWTGVKTAALFGTLLVAMHPLGMVTIGLLAGLEAEERAAMESSVRPEWRMIRAEYAGVDLPGSPGCLSFTLTNTGPHAAAQLDGHLHVWNAVQHAKIAMPVEPEELLQPGGSIRLNCPLDEEGRRVLNMLEGEVPDQDQPAPGEPQAADANPQLRYQLHRLTRPDGERFEIRSANLEPANCPFGYARKRDLTSPEWRLVKVEYLGMQSPGHPGRAAFNLRMPQNYRLTRLKGTVHVLDIEEKGVEKEVELDREEGMQPGESVVFALPAGKDSELADGLIKDRSAYDQTVGNADQTSYILRFQVQAMKTADGQSLGINWLGGVEIKE